MRDAWNCAEVAPGTRDTLRSIPTMPIAVRRNINKNARPCICVDRRAPADALLRELNSLHSPSFALLKAQARRTGTGRAARALSADVELIGRKQTKRYGCAGLRIAVLFIGYRRASRNAVPRCAAARAQPKGNRVWDFCLVATACGTSQPTHKAHGSLSNPSWRVF